MVSFPRGTDFQALGFVKPVGFSIKIDDSPCVRGGLCQVLCNNCSIPPQSEAFLKRNKDRFLNFAMGQPVYSVDRQTLKDLGITDNQGNYTPYQHKIEHERLSEVKQIAKELEAERKSSAEKIILGKEVLTTSVGIGLPILLGLVALLILRSRKWHICFLPQKEL